MYNKASEEPKNSQRRTFGPEDFKRASHLHQPPTLGNSKLANMSSTEFDRLLSFLQEAAHVRIE